MFIMARLTLAQAAVAPVNRDVRPAATTSAGHDPWWLTTRAVEVADGYPDAPAEADVISQE